nr:DNA cytosine methyltransferase [Thiomicrorhabdus sp.]
IDLLTAGFPCQAWSNAGKQQGDKDPRGALVHDLIDIWKHITALNPNLKFMFENVRMKKDFMEYITELFGVEPILINSALVSAQNRQRYYWTNIEGIQQPEDKGLLLADIIESGEVDREKSLTVTTRIAGGTAKRYLEKSMHQMVIERPCELRDFNPNSLCHHVADASDINGNESIKRIYAEPGKAPTLITMGGGHREPKVLTENKAWRKLTPLECERLQTLPDNYTLVLDENGKQLVSNSQRYKMIGNGWTINVVSHIFKGLLK